jgi:hypothetical protein
MLGALGVPARPVVVIALVLLVLLSLLGVYVRRRLGALSET